MTRPSFAHASEEELARILDYYEIRWEYEPRRFPILWNLDGKVVESFSPDFYLPDLDLFLELTTLKQSLVRRKNRKLRRLRELYPDVRIKLLYGKDFKALMLKYGRIALAASLSGPEGQARSPRAKAVEVADAAASQADLTDASLEGFGDSPPEPVVANDLVIAELPRANTRRRRRRAAAATVADS